MNDSNRSKATRAPTTTDDDDARSRASHASRRTRLSRLSARARHFRAPPSVVVVVVVNPIQSSSAREARPNRSVHPPQSPRSFSKVSVSVEGGVTRVYIHNPGVMTRQTVPPSDRHRPRLVPVPVSVVGRRSVHAFAFAFAPRPRSCTPCRVHSFIRPPRFLVDGRRETRVRSSTGRGVGRADARTDGGDMATSGGGGASALAYGLNLPAKAQARARAEAGGTRPPTLAAFANDSDDEDDDDDDDDPAKARARANAEVRRQQEAMAAKRARDAANAAATTSAALKEDANAFEYDAVFDDLERSRGHKAKELANERVERKSRYIEDLMAKANARKKENDASYERRLLKERLKEDHLYADKDKFVTAAYRAKLKEDAKWLAEEKARDAKEEEEDVTRRGASAMTAFYSNVLHGKTASTGGKAPENGASETKLTSAADRDRELIARAQAEAAATVPAIPDDVTLIERVEKPAPLEPTPAPVEAKVDPNARRNTDSDVSDARARYLARKRKAT